MISPDYDHIWDCCCDHGFLGQLLLERKHRAKIHFVDIVEQLVGELDTQLTVDFPGEVCAKQWQTHCIDAAMLPLATINSCHSFESTHDSIRHLIIIAGVGGERTIMLMDAILAANAELELDFLICPVHHNYQVRERADQWSLGLVGERLITENGRFYELMHLSSLSMQPITAVGDKMWDFTRPDDRAYLLKTIKHYQRIQDNGGRDVAKILADYRRLLTSDAYVETSGT